MDFSKEILNKSDDEIYAILASKDDYLPGVVDLAEQEFRRRRLDPFRLASRRESRALESMERSRESLEWWLGLLFFLFPMVVPLFLLGEGYRNLGARRKYREIWRYMFLGILFWLLLSALLWYLSVYKN